MRPTLALVVIRCVDLAASKRFYEALGLVFIAERHGRGPEHWSCRVGTTLLELYPAEPGGCSNVRLGFYVDDVGAAAQAAVVAGGRVATGGAGTVVVAPDGTKVELWTQSPGHGS